MNAVDNGTESEVLTSRIRGVNDWSVPIVYIGEYDIFFHAPICVVVPGLDTILIVEKWV